MARASLLSDRRLWFADGSFVAIRVWSVPEPVPPSGHVFKYRLVYIINGERIIGYDNERGKGDHRHHRGVETPYSFHSIERLLADFLADVEAERNDPNRGNTGR